MATETVPADIAAAIANHGEACARAMTYKNTETWVRAVADARAALDAAILTHLRKADELKAALERITSGGA